MEFDKIEIQGKIGKLHFSYCPNCKKYLVFLNKDTITCDNCRKKYEVEFSDEC